MIPSANLLAVWFNFVLLGGGVVLESYFLRGAGKVASGVFNEVSLALVGVSLPGLIPIIVYFLIERNSFLYGPG
jgi:hypothetical protein